MTRLALFAAAIAAAAAVLTACGGEDATGSDSSASSTVSTRVPTSAPAAGSAESAPPAAPEPPVAAPEPPVAAPVPPVAPPAPPVVTPAPPVAAPVTDPCAVVIREYLITTLRMTGGPRFPLADLEQPRCSGDYATARSVPDGETQPSMYLFHYVEQDGQLHWRVIDLGSALDCVNRNGVPTQVARQIGCGA